MYSSWKNPTSSKRQQELAWIGIINSCHDQFCHCDDPTNHLLYCLNKFSGFQKPEADIRNIQCLLTGITPTTEEKDTKTEEEGGFYEGELEKLFEEGDTEPKENADTTAR